MTELYTVRFNVFSETTSALFESRTHAIWLAEFLAGWDATESVIVTDEFDRDGENYPREIWASGGGTA